MPSEAGCDLGSNVQVDHRNKEISTRSDQSSDVAKASFRVRRTHMAEKPVGNYNVLRPQSIDHSWISSIAKAPIHALSDPRLAPEVAPLPFEHLLHFLCGHSFHDRSVPQFAHPHLVTP